MPLSIQENSGAIYVTVIAWTRESYW